MKTSHRLVMSAVRTALACGMSLVNLLPLSASPNAAILQENNPAGVNLYISTSSTHRVYLPLIYQETPRSHARLFFGPIQAGSAIDGPIADVAAADVDRDGDQDLIGVYPAGPELAISYNDGTGGFSQPWFTNENAGTADLLHSVAPADIDQDGDIDLISATWNGFFGVPGDENTLAINRNRGDGTFEVATLIPVSHPTTQVVTSDFNGDGKVDIASTYKDTDSVVVLLNSGQGQFSAFKDYNSGQDLWSLTVADLNGDGSSDLITVALSGDIVLLINQGQGTFSIKHLILPAGVQDIAAGDFDQDADRDLVALNSTTNTLTILRNRGNAVFDAGQVIASDYWINSVTVADFDGDNCLDLAVANFDAVTVSVYRGLEQGLFMPAGEFIIGQEPHNITAADINGDGRPDILAAANNLWAVILLNLGGGEFETIDPPYSLNPGERAFEAGDLNGDGYPDLVSYHTANIYQSIVTTYLNDRHGHFSLGQEIQGYDSAYEGLHLDHPLAASDFDSDKDLDVLFASQYFTPSQSGVQFCLMRNNGLGELELPGDVSDCARLSGDFLEIRMIKAADLDRDRDLDLVVARDAGITVLFNDGQGKFGNAQDVLSQGSYVLVVADLNGDKLPDIVVSDPEIFNQQLLVLLNRGNGAFGQPAPFDAVWGGRYSDLTAGDVDHDANLDLILIYETTPMVDIKGKVFLNDGSAHFSPGSDLFFPGQSPNAVVLADVDLDHNLDVLGTTNWNQTVTINFNDEVGRYEQNEPLMLAVLSHPVGIVAADLDLDGDIDVATIGDGALTIRENALRKPAGIR